LKTIFLFACCIFLCGCASPQPIRFGMFQVPEKNLRDAQALGIDFVVGSSSGAYLEEAARLNLKVITQHSNIKHRAIVGSILTDEPDLHGIPPERIAQDYKAAKRRSRKPIFLNLSSAYAAEAYRENCDVLMFDWFPIGWMPIETFYSQLRITRLAAGKKPFFVVIQAFDWSRYPDLMPVGSYRKPTPVEIKAMTIWAAMNGANGIAYYPFNDRHFSLEEAPEISAAIKESISIVRDYDWLFESPRVWIDYPFQFQSSADKTNAVAETSIAIRAGRASQDPGTTFLVAANTTDREIVVKPLVPFDETNGAIHFAPLEVKFLTARQRH
jgi:hypothetical protein